MDAVNEARIVRRIEEAGPRFVLLVNQAAPAFGSIAFGKDYAVEVWNAVERNYRLVAAFGDPRPDAPVGSREFFIRVYERRPDAVRGSRLTWNDGGSPQLEGEPRSELQAPRVRNQP